MSLRGESGRIAGWQHWDMAALVAGAVPLGVLVLFYAEAAPASLNTLLLILSLVVYPVAALLSWRQGDVRLAAGGMLLILAVAIASPMIVLLAACLMGDCI